MSTVIVHRHAANYLRRLPKKTKKRIKDILKQLENDSLEHPDGGTWLEIGPDITEYGWEI